MTCKICNSKNTTITYNGKIRNGALGVYTTNDVPMYQYQDCKTIWHEKVIEDLTSYYESQEYRQSLEGTSEEADFYKLHDKESMDKFLYTGTTIFRGKVVADIGCGCGAFLDYIDGVASKVVAIEPSETYRKIMDKKGFTTFPYTSEALKVYMGGGVDVITSFDVIEHVEDPNNFLAEAYKLLAPDGTAIIGTPTDCPVMRDLLGEIYEMKQLFSTQHLFVLSGKALKMMAEKIGFKDIEVKYFQRYGIGNMMGWLREKSPRSGIEADYITNTLDVVWRRELETQGLADYVVLYARK